MLSFVRPFRHRTFAVIWIGTVVSNIGGWMSSAASGWLMTTLDPSPLIVALVQVAASAPVFLLAIPAGALSDIVDRRRFLVVGELFIMAASILFAVLVTRRLITPTGLLLMTFIVSVGTAMTAPAGAPSCPCWFPRPILPRASHLTVQA